VFKNPQEGLAWETSAYRLPNQVPALPSYSTVLGMRLPTA
jgi:hypothetical protein